MPSPVVRDAVISDFRRRVEAARRARAATLEDERDDDARVSASTRADPIRVGAFDALQRALWDGDGDGDGGRAFVARVRDRKPTALEAVLAVERRADDELARASPWSSSPSSRFILEEDDDADPSAPRWREDGDGGGGGGGALRDPALRDLRVTPLTLLREALDRPRAEKATAAAAAADVVPVVAETRRASTSSRFRVEGRPRRERTSSSFLSSSFAAADAAASATPTPTRPRRRVSWSDSPAPLELGAEEETDADADAEVAVRRRASVTGTRDYYAAALTSADVHPNPRNGHASAVTKRNPKPARGAHPALAFQARLERRTVAPSAFADAKRASVTRDLGGARAPDRATFSTAMKAASVATAGGRKMRAKERAAILNACASSKARPPVLLTRDRLLSARPPVSINPRPIDLVAFQLRPTCLSTPPESVAHSSPSWTSPTSRRASRGRGGRHRARRAGCVTARTR